MKREKVKQTMHLLLVRRIRGKTGAAIIGQDEFSVSLIGGVR